VFGLQAQRMFSLFGFVLVVFDLIGSVLCCVFVGGRSTLHFLFILVVFESCVGVVLCS
jgi:hypothetical protein